MNQLLLCQFTLRGFTLFIYTCYAKGCTCIETTSQIRAAGCHDPCYTQMAKGHNLWVITNHPRKDCLNISAKTRLTSFMWCSPGVTGYWPTAKCVYSFFIFGLFTQASEEHHHTYMEVDSEPLVNLAIECYWCFQPTHWPCYSSTLRLKER